MRYRVEQLAAACDVSVDTIRYYQSRGLLPPPVREGRVAWYDDRHAERIRQVRTLRGRGLTLAAIERVLGDGADPADADLAIAVAAARGENAEDELLTLDEFADRSGVPASLIQAVEREGIEQLIYQAAVRFPLFYGLLTVALAIGAGLAASAAFRRGSG